MPYPYEEFYDPDFQAWAKELADIVEGQFDEDGNLMRWTGPESADSWNAQDVVTMYRSRYSPREAAEIWVHGAGYFGPGPWG